MEFIVDSVEETIGLAKKIGMSLKAGDVILLDGDLGAGKTTFTKGIGQALEIERTINSPTFTIMKMYQGNIPLYHFDLYRLDGEGTDFDLEDYLFGEGICVVEWPQKAQELLPDDYLWIDFKRLDDTKRKITLVPYGERYEKIIEVLK